MKAVRLLLYVLALAASACPFAGCSSRQHRLTFDGRTLNVDAHAVPLYVAALHYWRMPSVPAWQTAFARLRDEGYNAVALDFFWGYHSPRPGVFDFSGVRDVDALLVLAQRAGLYVIAQPGPFIGAGAEADGVPDWLLSHNARAGSLRERYPLEARRWMEHIDAILARRQFSDGGGPVVLYEVGERRAGGLYSEWERRARGDGIEVPFDSRPFGVAAGGVNWGWTGDPLHAYRRYAWRSEKPDASATIVARVGGWRAERDDAEVQLNFEDQAWPPLGKALPADADEPAARALRAAQHTFLGVDDYGFHHGAVWYRGHFVARGTERAFSLHGSSGRGGACSAWLDGMYLGSAFAAADGSIDATFAIRAGLLRRGTSALLAVLFEDMGHNEGLDLDAGQAEPRGMLAANLAGGHAVAWHLLGNGEYNTDPVHGPLGAGGLGGEIAGWYEPDFDDRSWAAPPSLLRNPHAGVIWYRAHIAPQHLSTLNRTFALRIDDANAGRYRAEVFVNGWLLGHVRSGVAAGHDVPVPLGILRSDAANVVALAVWSMDARGGPNRVSLVSSRDRNVPPLLAPPPEVRASHGVARLTLDVVADQSGERPHFAYAGRDVAPTLRVRPGDALEVTVHDRLPRSTLTHNAVNLHFHGLDVAPRPPGDDVLTTLALPGESLHYEVHVPATQPPGLYWYHPHAHGETYWQVTSGMAGAIVVEGLQARVSALRALHERTLVVRDVQDVPDIMAIPWYARRMTLGNRKPGGSNAPVRLDADDNPPAEPCLPEAGLHLTVDGTFQPAIQIGTGERQLFRVLNASAGRVLDLEIDGEALGLAALDGYPVQSARGNPAVTWVRHIVVPPAGRAEFIATGQAGPALLRSRCYDSGPGGDRDPDAVLASLVPSGTAASALPNSIVAADASEMPIAGGLPRVRRTVRLSEDARGFYIDGRAFAMDAPPLIVAHAGTLEEWTLINDTDEVHAFHVHQVHVLTQYVNGVRVAHAVWLDTVIVPVRRRSHARTIPGTLKILVDFRNPAIRGTFVFHCHMLDHEDGGMMAKIQVL